MSTLYVLHDPIPGDPTLIEWVKSQGVDPEPICLAGQHWTRLDDDGAYVWQYLEFILDENGKRILMPLAIDGYQFGPESTYAKRPRVRRVTSLPPAAILVAGDDKRTVTR